MRFLIAVAVFFLSNYACAHMYGLDSDASDFLMMINLIFGAMYVFQKDQVPEKKSS